MQKLFTKLTAAFRAGGGYLDRLYFDEVTKEVQSELFVESDVLYELLKSNGYPIEAYQNGYRLTTCFAPVEQQLFCIVDIETSGGKPSHAQIIEIGALKVEDGRIIDRFETFVSCSYLPEYITKVTGIEPCDLKGAPHLATALEEFRTFLGDAVFVAHNVGFDFHFLDVSFEQFGLGNIGNPFLCTIDLAKRTFESERYGLAFLRESLGIDTHVPMHHRAYADALSAYHVMQKSLSLLPNNIKTTDQLLQFSKSKLPTTEKKQTST